MGQIGEKSKPTRGMLDDDDDDMIVASAAVSARKAVAAARGGGGGIWKGIKGKLTGAPRVYEGERKIFLNNPSGNAGVKYVNNSVSTSKYNVITFVPKFLFGTFLPLSFPLFSIITFERRISY